MWGTPAGRPLHERLKALRDARERQQRERDMLLRDHHARDEAKAKAREREVYLRRAGAAAAAVVAEVEAIGAAPMSDRSNEVAAGVRRRKEWGPPVVPEQLRLRPSSARAAAPAARPGYAAVPDDQRRLRRGGGGNCDGTPLPPIVVHPRQPPPSAPASSEAPCPASSGRRPDRRSARCGGVYDARVLVPLPDIMAPLHHQHNQRCEHHIEQQRQQQQRVAAEPAGAREREDASHRPRAASPVTPASPGRRQPSAAVAAAGLPSGCEVRAGGGGRGGGAGIISARQAEALARFKAARSRSPSPDRHGGGSPRTRAAAAAARSRSPLPQSPPRSPSPPTTPSTAEAPARFKAARSRSPSLDRHGGVSPRTRAAAAARSRSPLPPSPPGSPSPPTTPSTARRCPDLNLQAARMASKCECAAAGARAGVEAVPGMDRVRRPARHVAAAVAEMAGAGARPLTPQKRDSAAEVGLHLKKFRC